MPQAATGHKPQSCNPQHCRPVSSQRLTAAASPRTHAASEDGGKSRSFEAPCAYRGDFRMEHHKSHSASRKPKDNGNANENNRARQSGGTDREARRRYELPKSTESPQPLRRRCRGSSLRHADSALHGGGEHLAALAYAGVGRLVEANRETHCSLKASTLPADLLEPANPPSTRPGSGTPLAACPEPTRNVWPGNRSILPRVPSRPRLPDAGRWPRATCGCSSIAPNAFRQAGVASHRKLWISYDSMCVGDGVGVAAGRESSGGCVQLSRKSSMHWYCSRYHLLWRPMLREALTKEAQRAQAACTPSGIPKTT